MSRLAGTNLGGWALVFGVTPTSIAVTRTASHDPNSSNVVVISAFQIIARNRPSCFRLGDRVDSLFSIRSLLVRAARKSKRNIQLLIPADAHPLRGLCAGQFGRGARKTFGGAL